MTDSAIRDPSTAGEWEQYRVELMGYCYRMLGSPFDAEDAVQETFFRAWRGRSLSGWAGARNPALRGVMGSARSRRSRAPRRGRPAEHLVLRESIRLAFIAALQLLPARQRAVLILRDVLAYSALETADILDTSVAFVTSALQRARATLTSKRSAPAPLAPASESLLRRYCEAFESNDIDALVELLHEDGTTSMPPLSWGTARARASHCGSRRSDQIWCRTWC